ncbi:malto-oligosyltrehalose synthase [Roseivivax isoporae]|uniref:Glycosyl hydrolase family 13 catalytic domain-containing protein n=1 Tax=Roseivivax isoporae LMG 25204 TaxID=1449351 RepID=X7FB14_9RHOB|nr:malto-oligosyltrehalose synthase [Roseivivax isoporae]ETX29306.1 hypothetical protein RISW2_01165 [Roseivivax isoporae LMG 25204]
MTLPSACYRLQFRGGMDLDRAAGLAPYLRELGVSHLYASPLFTAQEGSTHGYDVTDPTEIDPALGGRAALERLSEALKSEGLGLILDIVPNHLAFSVETPWLRDVLRHGRDSRFARHFDIDPGAERIRLPWLGAPFETLLAEGTFRVDDDPDGPVLDTGGLRVPLGACDALDRARGGDAAAIRALHAAQPWRLVHWRTESDRISHRRFFSITGLIGVRVEDPDVFEDTHRLIFDLVDTGIVDGIRIDHIDGLLDPAGYLARLRARVGDTPIWVEKILAGREMPPEDWPIQGTTGYVAARAFGRLLTRGAGLERIEARYRAATGRTDAFHDVMGRLRRLVMTGELAAELWTLHAQLSEIAARDPAGAELGPESLREALLAFIGAFPRYRTYMTAEAVSETDAAIVRLTAARAAETLDDPGALEFLEGVLLRQDAASAPFRLRLQQVTGAAVAKSQEDTAFFREVRLLSINEVGGEPDDDPSGIEGFHRAMARRVEHMPHGLTLTSSHDTKRSEDARMRIAAITHAPEAFEAWHRICAGFAPEGLDPNVVWYVAQTFLALDERDGDLAERLSAHVVKALREAKSETSWTAPDLDIEERAQDYVRRLARHFPRHAPEVDRIVGIADRMSLVQATLKLTAPGIPDIYQGTEFAFRALTDPDNRKPVDFDARQAALGGRMDGLAELDRQKFDLTQRLLYARRRHAALFHAGTYEPLPAPEDTCAFRRSHGDATLGVAVRVDFSGEAAALPDLAGAEVTRATLDGEVVARVTLAG